MTQTEKRIEIFKDTLKIAYSQKIKVYTEKEELKNLSSPLKIIWSQNTIKTIIECRLYYPFAALNFADPFEPGGLVWDGIKTQEEDLCRSSTLYRSLTQEDAIKNYYQYNKKLNKTTDRIIYSPKVLFFKNDIYQKINDPLYCNIITCAAPLPTQILSDQLVKKRMQRIIYTAKNNNNKYLILGNWGCGAFNNDLNHFKKLWKQVFNETRSILIE